MLTFILAAGSAASAAEPSSELDPPEFSEVSVHDPSIVTSGEDIWVFGSHAASARTTDLVHWEQHTVDLGITRDNSLFEDVDTELADAFAWVESDTLWATDVIELGDGRFYMYYNVGRLDQPRAAMGVAVADAVEGPYEDTGVFLRSGQRPGEPQQIPGEDFDASVDPNTVDPDVFYDAEGDLWMVYGSYSGGIFILEMDESTGKPVTDQGWGTHLIGGDHSRIEGPSIRYDEGTGYYYMFLSFGGLEPDGGYDVRVMRSAKPDGPYVDAEGNDMSAVRGTPGVLFDDEAYEPYGVKLMGGHRWLSDPEDASAGLGDGYVSPGHNSWYDNPDTGESFLVFHTRFPDRGGAHNVRAHQMWMTQDGWPVVSPLRFGGETAGPLPESDIAGDWQLVNMGKDITAEPATPSAVVFEADGDITGAITGSWTLDADTVATLTLDGESYSGHFVPVWDPDLETWATAVTLQNDHGVSLWGRGPGSQGFPLPTELESIAVTQLPSKSEYVVGDDLDLDGLEVTGTWTDSTTEVITADEFTVSGFDSSVAATVMVSVTSTEDASITTSFTVTVSEPAPVEFADVDESLEHYDSIMWLADRGITQGWVVDGETQFRPFNKITRDAMATFLYRYAGSPDVTLPAQSPFLDADDSSEHYEAIVWLAQEGISEGWDTNAGQEFRPFEPITRDAMAAFLYRLADEPTWVDPVNSPFVDITSTNTEFYTEITWLEDTGITNGWATSTGTEFRPFNETTRDAMAAFLLRFAEERP
ncbi:family 43 glycosylhydrolase [Demequina sp. SO4-13]|uniref:family 43 glycosylhydrolase n=1 Tax=Demequina sp. SO4-13 TaxID=3401027 RepID=UPI003AF585F2